MKYKTKNGFLARATFMVAFVFSPVFGADNEIEPLSPEEQLQSGQEGAQLGRTGATFTDPTLTEGTGETGAGTLNIQGEQIDVNHLLPGSDPVKGQDLQAAAADGTNLETLKAQTEAKTASQSTDYSVEGDATRLVESRAKRTLDRQKLLEGESVVVDGARLVKEGSDGNVLGEVFADCQTSTVLTPTDSNWGTSYEDTCERIVPPSTDPVCTREYVANPFTIVHDQDRRELLNVAGGRGGEVCRRERNVDTIRDQIAMSKAGDLNIVEEESGLSCRKFRWAEEEIETQSRSMNASLSINDEMGGLSCRRERWIQESTTTQGGSRTAELTIDDQVPGLVCTKSYVPSSQTTTVPEIKDAILDVNQEEQNGLICSRWFEPSQSTGTQAQTMDTTLQVSTETGGASCEVKIWPNNATSTQNQSQEADLNINTEVGGNICRRTIWPTTSTVQQNQSKSGTLNIDSQTGGLACTRQRWPNASTGSENRTQDGTLNVNNEQGGQVCQRRRWVTESSTGSVAGGPYTVTIDVSPTGVTTYVDLSSQIPPGTTSIGGLTAMAVGGGGGIGAQHWADIIQTPTAANGWRVGLLGMTEPDGLCMDRWGNPTSCPRSGSVKLTWTAYQSTRTWSINESGNCSDAGTSTCPTSWSCATQAPTTINGISVTATEVSALSALYSGSPSACTDGRLNKTCSTSNTSNTMTLSVPVGTTSVTVTGFTVQNPQAGITVTKVGDPTSANGWTVTFNVQRTNYTYTPVDPQVRVSYTVGTSGTSFTLLETGDCSDPGSSICPTSWACTDLAPSTLNGINVTSTMVSGLPALYPGANSSCLYGELSRTCSGSSTVGSTISIASVVNPTGATTINAFAWTVRNPQSGVSVSLVTAPAFGNGWVATFNVTRTNWGTVQQPIIDMTWTVPQSTTSLTVQDAGDCALGGTANCPATWACTGTAPLTVNGISVTQPMAQTKSPLYPGATNQYCVTASKDRTCSGNPIMTTTVSIASTVPASATTISNFAFYVANPQAGVTVTLVSAPTKANNWVATFNVQRTISGGAAPAMPHVVLTWRVDVATVAFERVTTGNCNDPGSTSCPTQWACTTHVPTTLNGISVTQTQATQFYPLYPGAPTTCAVGVLSRVCSGSTTVGTTVGIGHMLPPGTTLITNFTYNWLNPQGDVQVQLTTMPSLSNGWTATFQVTHVAGVTPSAPQLRLNWSIPTTTTTLNLAESGNCGAPPSPSCAYNWTCAGTAPVTINGITITPEMVAARPPIFPSAPVACVRGDYRASCSGAPTTVTTVSIADQIPAGTQTIEDFDFDVMNDQPGVSVALTQVPALANNWVARFTVTRATWGVVPDAVQVRLHWNRAETTTGFDLLTAGECDEQGSPNCPAVWSCTLQPPTTINGVQVTTEMAAALAPLYSGAPAGCLRGELNRECEGSAEEETQVSIADLIPEGVTQLENFSFLVENPQDGIVVTLVSAPAMSNGWVATFRVTRNNFEGTPARPIVRLNWEAAESQVEHSIRETGDCSDPGSEVCPTEWDCTQTAPWEVNGFPIDTDTAMGLPPLFPDANPLCVIGELSRVCVGTATLSSTVGIGALIPEGVTEISNLQTTVTNPQPGIEVVLMTAPSFANGWTAYYEVRRTDFTYQPVAPQITITFDIVQSNVVLSTQIDPNYAYCDDPGSPLCPTAWSCAASAPITINNVSVTPEMLVGQPDLYPGSPAACVEGHLRRTCAGSANVNTEIPIGELLPEGTQEIIGFEFTWTNENENLDVNLLDSPTLANGWVARFEVIRHYPEGALTPPKPHIEMTWTVMGPVRYEHSIATIGDCQVSGGDTCPAEWVCESALPAEIGEPPVLVTPEMIEEYGGEILYPGEGYGCATAALVRVCPGDGSSITEINISDQIPEGVTTLVNYGWEVSSEVEGVLVESLQDPTLENGWIAIFRTSHNHPEPPNQPEVYLHWQVTSTGETVEVIETGDCQKEGDEFCGIEWMCSAYAPGYEPEDGDTGGGSNPGQVGQKIVSVTGPRRGDISTAKDVSIADQIAPGTTEISEFSAQAIDGATQVLVVRLPSAANDWTARISVSGWIPEEEPQIPGEPPIFSAVATVKLMWVNAPEDPDGGPIGPGGLSGIPPLFEGAPEGCVAAARVYDCSGINGGQICHDTSNGPVCEDIEGGVFDNCDRFLGREDCRLDRTICNEDGRGEDGHCYLETDLYICRVLIEGQDYTETEQTVCNGMATTCLDGSCTETQQQIAPREPRSMSKALAHVVMNEAMNTDNYVIQPGPGAANGTAPLPPVLSKLMGGMGKPRPKIDGEPPPDEPPDEPPGDEPPGDEPPGDDPPGDPEPEEGPRGSGEWDPWSTPGDPDEGWWETDPSSGAATPPGGINPSNFRFFKGKSMNCMKALGGILNCCTKIVAPQETNEKWWEIFTTQMQERWSRFESCEVDQDEQGAHIDMIEDAGNASLNNDFTSAGENLTGGGEALECGEMPTMEDVNNQYNEYTQTQIRPRLAWFCDEDEFELATQKEVGNCVYLGDYCQSSIFGVCIDKRQRHCCFNSPMTKMMRQQLNDLMGITLGTAKNPQCDGITIDQLQRLDFNRMDTTDLEGRMVDAGAVPDLLGLEEAAAAGTNLDDLLTGTNSLINNDGRKSLEERTQERVAATEPKAARDSITESVEHLVPEQATPQEAAPGDISFVQSRIVTARDRWRVVRLPIELTRTGYQGQVTTRLQVRAEGEVENTTFQAPTYMTVSWGHGDTSTKKVTLYIYALSWPDVPQQQTRIWLDLIDLTGGATAFPRPSVEVVISPPDYNQPMNRFP